MYYVNSLFSLYLNICRSEIVRDLRQGWCQEFPDAGANVLDGGLNQKGQDNVTFIISFNCRSRTSFYFLQE